MGGQLVAPGARARCATKVVDRALADLRAKRLVARTRGWPNMAIAPSPTCSATGSAAELEGG